METQESQLLVVDDNAGNRDILSRQLRRRGYEVLLAENGERALEVVAKHSVDLVILDIMMPGIDGIEVLKRLRQKHSMVELPILMATAKTDTQDVVQCLELGANDHVGKPFDFEVISAKVQSFLRLKATATPMRRPDGEPTLGDLKPGSVIADRYRLDQKIGTGTFGAVYKGLHQELDLEIAIKVLQPSVTANDAAAQRFRQEGIAACRVRHPNAVAVSDCGVTSAGVAFLVMELLVGRSLDREIRAQGKLSPLRANEILQPVCDVLAEAHANDLVHRDVKPENVFLHESSRGEIVKVLDFGIAKLVGEAAIQENLTAEGWILGTPAYMAPERLSGQGYDGRTDVYSLGIMAFEMLTGRKPFDTRSNDPMSIITQHVNKEPPTLRSIHPEVPEELEQPIAWALAKKPEDRPDAPTFATAFAEALELSEQSDAGTVEIRLPRPQTPTEPVELKRPKPESGLLGRWMKKLKKPDSG